LKRPQTDGHPSERSERSPGPGRCPLCNRRWPVFCRLQCRKRKSRGSQGGKFPRLFGGITPKRNSEGTIKNRRPAPKTRRRFPPRSRIEQKATFVPTCRPSSCTAFCNSSEASTRRSCRRKKSISNRRCFYRAFLCQKLLPSQHIVLSGHPPVETSCSLDRSRFSAFCRPACP